MSQPNLPNITPNITLTRDDALNLLLSSIAFEELGLAHIINAEGEKIQFALGTLPGVTGPVASLQDVLNINSSVRDTLEIAMKKELLLGSKLDTVSDLIESTGGPTGPTGPTGAIGVTGPTGITGPAGRGLGSFAYISQVYPTNTPAAARQIAPGGIIPFNTMGPFLNITFNGTDTLTVQNAGIYEITPNVMSSVNSTAGIPYFGLQINGTVLAENKILGFNGNNQNVPIIITLTAGSIIRLVTMPGSNIVQLAQPADFGYSSTIGTNISASITVIQLI
ncbi:collagen-like protein [Bacillus cereus]|uniref:collagen-like protein n=1 Tax=Bacillus cereus TaxID=1396 RepID=UPI003980A546